MNKETIANISLFVLCVLNLLFMHAFIITTCQVEEVLDWTSWVTNASRISVDAWIVLTLCLLISRSNLKTSFTLTFFITLIWSFSNTVYSHFFFHYISLSSISEAGALADELVFNSMLAGLSWADLYYPVAGIVFVWIFKFSGGRVSWIIYMKKSILTLVSLFVLELSANVIYCASNPALRYFGYYKRRMGMRLFGNNHLQALPIYANLHNGSLKSLGIEALLSIRGNITLSNEQINAIENNLALSSKTITRNERPDIKNVIFILVESYMSFVTDLRADGKEVTPYLNALKRDTTVYYNGQVHPNITIGESSDGQYIYMTGLLPLRSMITVSKACKKTIPGLPKSLMKAGISYSKMILPTSSSLWRQDDMCRQYGFDRLYASNEYPGDHKQTLTDEQVFKLAQITDKETNEPFFSIILTATMHQPYNKIVDSGFIIVDSNLSDEMKCYLNACHYTDRCIGQYLEHLKRTGLYSNSLIVIASDHHVHTRGLGDVSTDIPLFVINGNIGSSAYHGKCEQVDVYTTLIDVMAIKDAWPGIGHSLLDNGYTSSLVREKWDVSEWILLSNYYERY